MSLQRNFWITKRPERLVFSGKNEPPKARAANVTVHLPRSVAVLNASASTDDAGIVKFLWQPMDNVPASMVRERVPTARYGPQQVLSDCSRWI